ncbi:hypothetical protein BDV29DRAFT_181449 [Aspergillus leporis]|uniref:Uncharacterized protein n=1 Tax=Aspergillus leporis TaxID=41062 RepID=A0A5N5WPD9_9EURO|nr:hypothetical protein BDV29DRAFT_181449 [Aspergillus leporis]
MDRLLDEHDMLCIRIRGVGVCWSFLLSLCLSSSLARGLDCDGLTELWVSVDG